MERSAWEWRALPLSLYIVIGALGCFILPHVARGEVNTLDKVETFEAPTYPGEYGLAQEVYDYRKEIGMPVPDSEQQALVHDLLQRVYVDLQSRKKSYREVTAGDIRRACDVYLYEDWRKIGGVRPWTHWHFIRSLSDAELENLAMDVFRYMNTYVATDTD